jgi:hypothetical protein
LLIVSLRKHASGAKGQKKRAGGGPSPGPAGPPSAKKPKVDDAAKFVSLDSLPGHELMNVPMLSIKCKGKVTCSISVRANHKIFICNPSAEAVELVAGAVLCGFGKGKFKSAVPDTDQQTGKSILYSLSSDEDKVISGSVRI